VKGRTPITVGNVDIDPVIEKVGHDVFVPVDRRVVDGLRVSRVVSGLYIYTYVSGLGSKLHFRASGVESRFEGACGVRGVGSWSA
jgi:hypothetical protein